MRNGSNQQKLLQRIAEDTETKIHPDGPKLRPVRLEAGWAAIPEPQVVQAVPKAIFTSSLLQVRSFSYNNEFRTELKYLSTYVSRKYEARRFLKDLLFVQNSFK